MPIRRLVIGLVIVLVGAGVAMVLFRMGSDREGARLVYAATEGVFERDLVTGRDRKVTSLPRGVQAAMPSPDGRHVAYVLDEGEVWIVELERSGERFQVARRLTIPLGWSPDGRLVAGELLSDRDLVAIDPDGGRDILMSGGYMSGAMPVWIDDSRFAIQDGEDSFVIVGVIVEGAEASDPIDGLPLAASPQGDLYVAREGAVVTGRVTDHEIGDTERVFRHRAHLAAAGPDGTVALATKAGLFIVDAPGKSTRIVKRRVDWVGWGPPDTLLFASDGAAFAVDLAGAPQEEQETPRRVTRDDAHVLGFLSLVVVR